ncbi:MAG: TIGR03617 family F420-dependent LLM class oxidoreductase [Pseudomonadota bacterium]|nr:TIGR03617 family F420-dependent LLM class oxidoreductase [Pseudomonadota bacterium]
MKVDGALFPGVDDLRLYDGNLDIVPARARMLEEAGFDGLYTLETNVDPFFNMLLAAEHTTRIELITGVAIAFARSPMTVALQSWNLQSYSRGRFILGIGSQVKAHIEKRFSMPWHGPAKQMREYVLALRSIWNSWAGDGKLDFRGEFYTHTVTNPVFTPERLECPPPKIYVGGLGPRMVEMAGEVADGLFGHPFITMPFIREVQVPALRRGLAKSGRTLADFDMPGMIITVTGRNEAEMERAKAAARRLLAFYGSTPPYYQVLAMHGWGDLGPLLNTMTKQNRWADMPALITDEIMEAFCVIGAPADIPGLIGQRCAGLVDRLTLYAPYPSAPEMWPDIVAGIKALPGKSAELAS